MGNTYGTSFVNNDEIKIRTPILIAYYKEKIKNAEDNILNIDVTRIKLQNDVTTKDAAFKAAEILFKGPPLSLTNEAAFKIAKGALDLEKAELANLTPTHLTEELHKILKDPLEWDIPEITTLFEETKKKYPIAPPPTTSGTSTASAGAPVAAAASSAASAGGSATKGSATKNNIDFTKLQAYIAANVGGVYSSKIKELYNKADKGKKGWLNDIKDYIRKNLPTADSNKIFIDTIAKGTKLPNTLGGARPSRKHRKTPERQSYRRPRTRGIATRKNHRLRQGE